MINFFKATYNEVIEGIIKDAVAHFDESGIFIDGSLNWLHVASNELLTAYYVHAKIGTDVIVVMDILIQFRGFIVHAATANYNTNDNAIHALCNAHYPRKLDVIFEAYGQPWALKMRQHLQAINKTVSALKMTILKSNSERCDQILLETEEQIPITKQGQAKQRGRIGQHSLKKPKAY